MNSHGSLLAQFLCIIFDSGTGSVAALVQAKREPHPKT